MSVSFEGYLAEKRVDNEPNFIALEDESGVISYAFNINDGRIYEIEDAGNGKSVWVLAEEDESVYQIDPKTNRLIKIQSKKSRKFNQTQKQSQTITKPVIDVSEQQSRRKMTTQGRINAPSLRPANVPQYTVPIISQQKPSGVYSTDTGNKFLNSFHAWLNSKIASNVEVASNLKNYKLSYQFYRKKFQEETGYQPTQATLNAKGMKIARIQREEQIRQENPQLIHELETARKIKRDAVKKVNLASGKTKPKVSGDNRPIMPGMEKDYEELTRRMRRTKI